MRTPATYVAFRATTTTITFLVLLFLGLGLAGTGPLRGLGPAGSDAISWLHIHTGVKLG
jgi:hypothetical protein